MWIILSRRWGPDDHLILFAEVIKWNDCFVLLQGFCYTVRYYKEEKKKSTVWKKKDEHYQGYGTAWVNCTLTVRIKAKYIYAGTYHNRGWCFLPRCHSKQAKFLSKWSARAHTLLLYRSISSAFWCRETAYCIQFYSAITWLLTWV